MRSTYLGLCLCGRTAVRSCENDGGGTPLTCGIPLCGACTHWDHLEQYNAMAADIHAFLNGPGASAWTPQKPPGPDLNPVPLDGQYYVVGTATCTTCSGPLVRVEARDEQNHCLLWWHAIAESEEVRYVRDEPMPDGEPDWAGPLLQTYQKIEPPVLYEDFLRANGWPIPTPRKRAVA